MRTPGWRTDRRTRRQLVDVLSAVCRDREFVCRFSSFAEEASHFVWSGTRKRYEAAHGQHDDILIAAGIAVVVADVRKRTGQRRAGSKVQRDENGAYRAWLQWRDKQEKMRKQGPIVL